MPSAACSCRRAKRPSCRLLDCTTGGVGIYLGPKSTLDLNGFTLTVAEDMIAVFCQHQSCAVVSRAVAPGVLEGNGEAYYWLIPNLQPDERPTVRKLLSGNPIDIDSERRPRLTSATCDHSNWDVCALD